MEEREASRMLRLNWARRAKLFLVAEKTSTSIHATYEVQRYRALLSLDLILSVVKFESKGCM